MRLFPSHIFSNKTANQAFIVGKDLLYFFEEPQPSLRLSTYPWENWGVSSFDNSKKLSVGAAFLSQLLSITTDWWKVINIVLRFQYIIGSLKQWQYHWFIEGKCLLATLKNSAYILMMTLPALVCLNTWFITVTFIPSTDLFPWWTSF